MTIVTKHLLKAREKLRLRREEETPESASIALSKLTLTNNNLQFGLSAEVILSIDIIENSPAYQTSEGSNIYIKTLKTEDKTVKEALINSSQNYHEFMKVVSDNQGKIEQIDTPYNNKGTRREKTLQTTEIISFKPLALKEKNSPENLSIFSVAVIESEQSKKALAISKIVFQDIIVGNELLSTGNINDIRSIKLESYLDFDIVGAADDNNKAYFSDQFISLDKDGYLKFIFMWDKIRFLQEMSLFGNILRNGSMEETRRKIIEDSRISNIKISRRRVKRSINGFSNFNSNQKNEVVISSSDDDSGDLLKNRKTNLNTGKIQSEISSMDNIKNSKDYIAFAINDYAPRTIKYGTYQYFIDVEVQDGMLRYLLDSLSELRGINKTFLEYQSTFFSPNPDTKTKTLEGVGKILEILFTLGKFSAPEKGRIERELSSLMRFIDGFETLISFNDEFMNKISYALSKRGVSSTKGKDATYRKNVSKLFFLQDHQKFSEIIDFSDLLRQKDEYLDIEAPDTVGIATFSENSIKDRFMEEFEKNINFKGDYDGINFSDLNEKLTEDNLNVTQNAEIFDLKSNFFSYLSPASVFVGGKDVKNNSFNPNDYTPDDNSSLDMMASELLSKGIKIMSPVSIGQNNRSRKEATRCSESIFGENDIINNQKTYENQSELDTSANSERHYKSLSDSKTLATGIGRHYNNFNLKKEDYNLSSPSNFLKKKKSNENIELLNSELEDMPNQVRVLFGSNSELVKNRWNLTENDLFMNPQSAKMMQENYSNLIKVEVLSDFSDDASGSKNIKLPVFRKLKIEDIVALKSGETLFCKTYILNDQTLGIGQRNISDNESIYYNKYFLIKKEESE